eukprot:11172845-Lingulodinium_polyedra.AAC.1
MPSSESNSTSRPDMSIAFTQCVNLAVPSGCSTRERCPPCPSGSDRCAQLQSKDNGGHCGGSGGMPCWPGPLAAELEAPSACAAKPSKVTASYASSSRSTLVAAGSAPTDASSSCQLVTGGRAEPPGWPKAQH